MRISRAMVTLTTHPHLTLDLQLLIPLLIIPLGQFPILQLTLDLQSLPYIGIAQYLRSVVYFYLSKISHDSR